LPNGRLLIKGEMSTLWTERPSSARTCPRALVGTGGGRVGGT